MTAGIPTIVYKFALLYRSQSTPYSIRIIHNGKMKPQAQRPMVPARQPPTGYPRYFKKIRTLKSLIILTYHHSKRYELSLSSPRNHKIRTVRIRKHNLSRARESKAPPRYLHTQQRVKNPGHAWLERKNAFTGGLGQIIFPLDVIAAPHGHLI